MLCGALQSKCVGVSFKIKSISMHSSVIMVTWVLSIAIHGTEWALRYSSFFRIKNGYQQYPVGQQVGNQQSPAGQQAGNQHSPAGQQIITGWLGSGKWIIRDRLDSRQRIIRGRLASREWNIKGRLGSGQHYLLLRLLFLIFSFQRV